MQEQDMPLVEHLSELRKRLIWVVLVLAVSMIAGLFVADPIINYLKSTPQLQDLKLNALSPWDSVRVYMQFSLAIAIVVTLPFALYQLWCFVKPGLHEIEQKATVRYIPLAVALLLVGIAFSYFVVFRMALYFTSMMADRLQLQETYGIVQYFTFMFNIVLPVSVLFELPVVVMFLTAIRLLNPKRLHKFRRFAYFILLILSAIVTPPDILSAVIVMIPLVILYEFSVLLSARVYRKQLARDRAWEADYGEK